MTVIFNRIVSFAVFLAVVLAACTVMAEERPLEIRSVEVTFSGAYEEVNIKTSAWATPGHRYFADENKLILTFLNAVVIDPKTVTCTAESLIKEITFKTITGEALPSSEVIFVLKGRIKYDVANMMGKNLTVVELAANASEIKPAEISKKDEQIKEETLSAAPTFELTTLKPKGTFKIFLAGSEFKADKTPLFSGDILMVPAGDFFEALSAQVSVIRDGVLTIRRGDTLKIDIDAKEKIVKLNGKDFPLTLPPRIIKKGSRSVVYIPLTSAARMADYSVAWDKKTMAFYVNPVIKAVSFFEGEGYCSLDISFSDALLDNGIKTTALNDLITIEVRDFSKSEMLPAVVDIKKGGIKKVIVNSASKKALLLTIALDSKKPFRVSALEDDTKLSVIFSTAVVDVRCTREAAFTKIEMSFDGPVSFETKDITSPRVIALDFPSTILAAFLKVPAAGGIISSASLSQVSSTPPRTRLSLSLLSKTTYKTFLSADGKKITIIIAQPKTMVVKTEPQKYAILKDKVIVIDPGHGGRDPGTIGFSGTYEKNATLSQALRIAEALERAGATVLLTRERDLDLKMSEITGFANDNKADIFLAVHYNSFMSPYVSGTETYYYTPQSRFLARIIHKNLARGIRRRDRGIKRVMYYTIHHTTMPAVLIEPGYVTNPKEEKLAFSTSFQKEVASDILKGVVEYFTAMKKYGR